MKRVGVHRLCAAGTFQHPPIHKNQINNGCLLVPTQPLSRRVAAICPAMKFCFPPASNREQLRLAAVIYMVRSRRTRFEPVYGLCFVIYFEYRKTDKFADRETARGIQLLKRSKFLVTRQKNLSKLMKVLVLNFHLSLKHLIIPW